MTLRNPNVPLAASRINTLSPVQPPTAENKNTTSRVASATIRSMRIIAGEFRGRKILSPQGDTTRPVTDRVKQSLFDILMPMIPDARVYDCFAGTGSMGLECLSRGASHVTFFEADRSAITLLRENIDTLKVTDRTTIVSGDLFKWFADLPTTGPGDIDLIFLDPPYRFLKERPGNLQTLGRQMQVYHLSDDGIIIFRHDAADSLALPLRRFEVRTYGSMTLEFLRRDTTDHGQQTTDN